MKIRQDSSLLWRVLDDEIVALDLKSSTYLRLNHTGAVLWQKLRDAASREALVGALVERYDIAEERAREDVDMFLADLEKSGLLET